MSPRIVPILVFTAALTSGTVSFGQKHFDDAQYLKAASVGEKKGQTVKGILRFDGTNKEVQFVAKGGTAFTAKYDTIKHLLYERTARPRYVSGILLAWPLLFTKGKKHFLTIQYVDGVGTGQFAVVRLDKSNFREALATAEAETGTKVERAEED